MRDRDNPAGSIPTTRSRLGLLVGTIAFIVYGSLYPFRFDEGTLLEAIRAWRTAEFLRPDRGDFIANLLLYIPFGGLVVANLASAIRSSTVLLMAGVIAAVVLSATIETLQHFAPARNSSLTDIVLNALGAMVGCGLALARPTGIRLPVAERLKQGARDSRTSIALSALWLLDRTFPFVPTIDLQKYKDSLKPLWYSREFQIAAALPHVLGWICVGLAVRSIFVGPVRIVVWASIAIATLLAQVVVVGRALSADALVGLAAAAAVLRFWPRSATTPRSECLALGIGGALTLIATGLVPFTLAAAPAAMDWMPFRTILSGDTEIGIRSMLGKAFLLSATIWALSESVLPLRWATTLTALVAFAIEACQRWIPGRTPDVTDPVLAVLCGLTIAAVSRIRA